MQPDAAEDILGPKKRNYQFLKLVRDKNYPDALLLGKLILKEDPANPSVKKFVEFIEKNAKKLDEMAKQQEQYQSAHSSDDSSEQQDEAEGQEIAEQKSQQDSKSEEQEEEQQQEKPQKKVELTTCTLNSIPHVCPRHHKLIIQAAKEGKV